MVDESLVCELVARWEVAREAGTPLTPEQVCAERPELLEAVRAALRKLYGPDDATVFTPDGGNTRTYAPVEPGDPPADSRDRTGQEVAGFRLLRRIGRGGFGQVFEAEDPTLRRKVAIKFLHPKALARPGVREQFLAEARSMAALQHDHVVPIYQVGEIDGQPFLVLPLLVGETLADRLKRDGSLPPAEVRRVGRELCLGLAALHAKGLIHRDIKPANLWLEMTTGRVTVLDLGLADEAVNLRVSGSAGTPAYMSPEQVDGLPLDFRSDLFSVGAVLYECATGRKAFAGDKLTDVLDAVRRSQPVPVREANPGVPADLADLIARLLNKDRTARPTSAQEVAEAVQPPATPTPSRRWLVGLAALLVVLGVVALVVALTRSPAVVTVPPPPPPPTEPMPPVPLAVESLQVIPWKTDGDRLKEALPPLGARDHVLPTTADAIEVKVQLSRKAYCYIVLYRSDGQDVCLFPQDDTDVPLFTDRPGYPSTRPDERYVLDDGPGIWAVAVVTSDTPLPSYRDWRAQHPRHPWKAQPDPRRLSLALLDTGRDWRTLGADGRYSRGEKKFQLEPYQQLVDWLQKQTAGGIVQAVAFPVQPH